MTPTLTRRGPDNATVGVSILVIAEMMFFAGLVSAYLVARARTDEWPPVGQPRLPVMATAFNSVLLVYSAYTLWQAIRGKRSGVMETIALGTAFVLLQGREWVRLIGYGLHISSGVYGAFFYTLVGAHALHVLFGLAALSWVAWMGYQGRALRPGAIYWWFVVALWPILYVVVYLL